MGPATTECPGEGAESPVPTDERACRSSNKKKIALQYLNDQYLENLDDMR
jgi:hypothetical protein